jgi:TRAP-type C4-dicarboxylate transport system permease small subunit
VTDLPESGVPERLRAPGLAGRFERAAELISAALFAALFVVFVIQVFSRYVVGKPTGWTLELTLVLFLWITFWNAALLLRERDHVAFDLIYYEVPEGPRRILAFLGTAAVVAAFAVSFLPSLDYVTFMKIERTWVLDIRFDLVFSCYILFLTGVIVFGLYRLVGLIGRRWRDHL